MSLLAKIGLTIVLSLLGGIASFFLTFFVSTFMVSDEDISSGGAYLLLCFITVPVGMLVSAFVVWKTL